MSRLSDKSYVKKQYQKSVNLETRIGLHAAYSVNPYGWFPWVFDALDLQPHTRVCEIGCGPGGLWVANAQRLPGAIELALMDMSPAMVAQARAAVAPWHPTLACLVGDAQALPFTPESFDLVIANHMLYHVPDRARALAEMRRILRPGGRLCAATNGRDHMVELREAISAVVPEGDRWDEPHALPFTLGSTGARELEVQFEDVTIRRYVDHLAVAGVEPLIEYAASVSAETTLGDRGEALASLLAQHATPDGTIRITKDSGLFLARRGGSD